MRIEPSLFLSQCCQCGHIATLSGTLGMRQEAFQMSAEVRSAAVRSRRWRVASRGLPPAS